MLKKLKINDFRALKNKEFEFGNYLTMLAGWNATGKSTVLALLAHSSELNEEIALTYLNKAFRSDFGGILKGSKTYDITEPDRFEITWEQSKDSDSKILLLFDEPNYTIKTFRTGWQQNRFRVIPKDKFTKTEEKFPAPVIYLGLSRLYPVGEADSKNITCESDTPFFKNDTDKQWFFDTYNKILSPKDNINNISNIGIKQAKKQTGGINTNTYDWKSNSSGQDNLSQILIAILSFKQLKEENIQNSNKGLLIIDEIEASLHPKSQEKIIDLLIQESKNNNFQTIFTTHSLSIIESVSKRIKNDNNDNIVSYYFTHENKNLEVKKNLEFSKIEDDLLLKPYKRKEYEKIIVYTEDEEAKWFLKYLIKEELSKYLKIPDMSIGCNNLIDLLRIEPILQERIIIFDGDLNKDQIKKIKQFTNYLCLPVPNKESKNPEAVIYNFIYSNDSSQYFADAVKLDSKAKIEHFNEYNFEYFKESNNKDRDVYKKWFKRHKQLFEDTGMFSYWMDKNQELIKLFQNNFLEKMNEIYKKQGLTVIKLKKS